MKELSLNILDIAMNSVAAGATLIKIELEENEDVLSVRISDNGCGMSEDVLKNVISPFCTSRKTRKVGLGIPFFKLASEQTGGTFCISSKCKEEFPDEHGTVTSASFIKKHLDFTPLGDIVGTVVTLVQGMGEGIDLVFTHASENREKIELDTRAVREILGEGVPLSTPDVLVWIKEFLKEKYNIL